VSHGWLLSADSAHSDSDSAAQRGFRAISADSAHSGYSVRIWRIVAVIVSCIHEML